MDLTVKNSSGKDKHIKITGAGIKNIPVAKDTKKLEICFALPLIDIQGYWHGGLLNGPVELLPWKIEYDFAFQCGGCIASFFNRKGVNALTFGLVGLPYDAHFTAKMNQELCVYDISLTFGFPTNITTPSKLSFYFDKTSKMWTDCVAVWREKTGAKHGCYPEKAFDPVYCTWYAAHAVLTSEWCEKTAKQVAKLGFKTFILDDGWCYDESKRVTPETIVNWYEWIGDWKISDKKFPDFNKHVAKIKKIGLSYLAWVTPFLIGTKSDFNAKYQKCKNALKGDIQEGHTLLNPENIEASEDMIERIVNFLKDSKLDGLKIDFLDQIAPDVDDPRSEATRHFIEKMIERIRRVKSDALIEFRQNYGTPQMSGLATQFRAGDAPFDFMLNFKRLVTLRLLLGDGVPIHADPAYWHKDEKPENISRHFIAMLAGVPMLSMAPELMNNSATKIVIRWLKFYEEHRETLTMGHWTLDYSNGLLKCAKVTGKKEHIVILADTSLNLDATCSKTENAKVILLNLSADKLKYSSLRKIENCFGRKCKIENGIPIGGLGVLE